MIAIVGIVLAFSSGMIVQLLRATNLDPKTATLAATLGFTTCTRNGSFAQVRTSLEFWDSFDSAVNMSESGITISGKKMRDTTYEYHDLQPRLPEMSSAARTFQAKKETFLTHGRAFETELRQVCERQDAVV
jgi:hypothetical protein